MTRFIERRAHSRLPCLADVVIEGKTGSIQGTLRDISLGGARVGVSPQDYPEPPLTLAVDCEGEKLHLKVDQVRRQGGDSEDVLGFRFIDVEREVLERLVNALRDG